MNKNGFTLIELMVTTLIMATLFSVGYANFRSYARKQELYKGIRQFEGHLRLAQRKALSGEGSNTDICNSNEIIYAYAISYGNNAYSIKAKCAVSVDATPRFVSIGSVYENISLPTGLAFSGSSSSLSDGYLQFATVKGSTNLSSDLSIIIEMSATGDDATIIVKTTGEIQI